MIGVVFVQTPRSRELLSRCPPTLTNVLEHVPDAEEVDIPTVESDQRRIRRPVCLEHIDDIVAITVPQDAQRFLGLVRVPSHPAQQENSRFDQLRVLQDKLPDDGRNLCRIPVPRDQCGEIQPRPDQVAVRNRCNS